MKRDDFKRKRKKRLLNKMIGDFFCFFLHFIIVFLIFFCFCLFFEA